MKTSILGKTVDELSEWVGKPTFRVRQILEWVYGKRVWDAEAMTNLSKELRDRIEEKFSFRSLEKVRVQDSGDGETFKFLWKLGDGKLVESVLICSGERRTVCVSSQVGCPAKCAFCASGKKGFFRNLDVGEIVEQVVQIDDHLKERGERVSHIVFMGMGEPLKNYENVIKTVRILIDPLQMGLSQRRITVSTVGVIEGIERMKEEGLKVNLVLSLHAPNQQIRKKVIPYARQYPLEDLLAAMDGYARKTGRDVTYEYILMAGLNDAPEHAEELAELLGRRQCTVNLIPYNPVPGLRLERPERGAVEAFRKVLSRKGMNHTCRYTKGDDIAAACGQLALLESTT
jgi:23S rRNA (adenine2503-C2)-methyltransferase